MKNLSLIALMAFLLTSCVVSRHQSGNYNNIDGNSKVYLEEKEIYLFWNQVPIRQIEQNLTITDYEKITKRTFFDAVTYYGTMGIYSAYTVKIKVKNTPDLPAN